MADICLTAVDVERSAAGVASLYGARQTGGMLDAWLIAEEDAGLAPVISDLGIHVGVAPLWMSGAEKSAALAADALSLGAGVCRVG